MEGLCQATLDLLLHHLRKGMGLTAACIEVGTSYSTVKARMAHDPQFAAVIKEARQVAIDRVEGTVIEMAIDGNLAAAKYVLNNRRPNKWREQVSQGPAPGSLTGHQQGAVQIAINMGQAASQAREIAGNPNMSARVLELLPKAAIPTTVVYPPQQASPSPAQQAADTDSLAG